MNNNNNNTYINPVDLMVIFHNVLTTDMIEKIYKEVKPEDNYNKVLEELKENIRKNPHKLTEEEKEIVQSEAEDMFIMLGSTDYISAQVKEDLKAVTECDFSESTLNGSGVGTQILDIWEGFKERIYDNQPISNNEYDFFQQLETIVFKTGYV